MRDKKCHRVKIRVYGMSPEVRKHFICFVAPKIPEADVESLGGLIEEKACHDDASASASANVLRNRMGEDI
jgi:hypothetical protein